MIVIKVTRVAVFDNYPLTFLDNRITLHNTIFPATSYELIGFCQNERSEFSAVTKQLFIEGEEPTDKEIFRYMTKDRKFTYIKEGEYISKDYIITDLFPRNFIKDKIGNMFCLDPVIKLNPQNRKYANI